MVAKVPAGTPTVGPGQSLVPQNGAVWLDVTVHQARWVKTERIRITIGGPHGPATPRG